MYCSVYGKVHIKDPLLLIEKSSLCGGSGFPSKKCVNVTILVHGLVACPCTPPKTKLGGYFIVAWVPLVKKNDVNRKKTHSQGTCHAPF